MARPSDYTAVRRWIMQATLLVILAGSLGLAMLVSRHKMAVKLTAPRFAGNVGARLPAGWTLVEENRPPVRFRAREPEVRRGRRSIIIRSTQEKPGTTAAAYLRDGSLQAGTLEELDAEQARPVTVAQTPGLLIRRKRAVEVDPDLPPIEVSVWLAAAVLPSGQTVSVELDCPIEVDAEADRTLLVNTAEGLSVTAPAQATPPATQSSTP